MAQIKCSVCGFDYDNSFSACPNCGNPTPAGAPQAGPAYKNAAPRTTNPAPAAPRANSEFGNQLLDALLHFLYRIVYFLFILPYAMWKNAVVRLSQQRRSHSLEATEIKSEWPLCSWLKRFIFDFLLDGLTLICWLVGLIAFFTQDGIEYLGFREILIFLYVIYIVPFLLSLVRDLLTLLVILPVRWWISFWKRPAKTYDLTHIGTIKKD